MKRFLRSLVVALALAMVAPIATAATDGFEHFIAVKNGQLVDGEEPFRFVSFNVPTLLYVEDEMAFTRSNPYGLPDEFELRDLFDSVVQMGGRVVRAYTIPVRNRDFPPESVTYVEAPGRFNEEAFRTMDRVLALANEYGVRLVIPLVNNWPWMGGRPQYAAFRGKDPDAFWTDPELIADFKQTIEHVLTRRNHLTGVAYRDDKAIMAWETGNELQNPPEWAIEIGRFIKSLDGNHLLIDGFHAVHSDGHDVWVPEYALQEPAFDLVSTHHYESNPIDLLANLREQVRRIDGRKPLFLGEFGFISTSGFEAVLDYVISEPAIPGALVWSLRRHHREGGFYHHTEPLGSGIYRAYHWPGFDDGESYDERRLLRLVQEKAFAIQGHEAPPIAPPAAPQLLPFEGAPHFSWRGSAGASGYDVQRADAADGPWHTLAYAVEDVDTPGFPLFSDESAEPGRSYFYRVIARNQAGTSPPSAPVGPVRIEHLTRVDRARNLGVLLASTGISVASGDHRSYKEAFSRLHGDAGAEVIYTAPGTLLTIRLFAFESDAKPNLELFESQDGEAWLQVTPAVESYASAERNYDYRVPIRYGYAPSDTDIRYLKAVFSDTADIVRVELDYLK